MSETRRRHTVSQLDDAPCRPAASTRSTQPHEALAWAQACWLFAGFVDARGAAGGQLRTRAVGF